MQHRKGGCHLPFGQAASLWWQNACDVAGPEDTSILPKWNHLQNCIGEWQHATAEYCKAREAKKGLGWEKCTVSFLMNRYRDSFSGFFQIFLPRYSWLQCDIPKIPHYLFINLLDIVWILTIFTLLWSRE